VLFNWAQDANADALEAIRSGLDQLAQLDMVVSYHHGPDVAVSDGNWDYALVADFESIEDYQRYAADSTHRDLVESLILPCMSNGATVQFEFLA